MSVENSSEECPIRDSYDSCASLRHRCTSKMVWLATCCCWPAAVLEGLTAVGGNKTEKSCGLRSFCKVDFALAKVEERISSELDGR